MCNNNNNNNNNNDNNNNNNNTIISRDTFNYVIIFSKQSIVKASIPKRVSAYCVGRIIYTTCPMDGSHECRLWRRPSLSLYVKDNSYLKAVGKRQQLLKSNIVLRLVVGSCYKADFPDHISVTFY